MADVSGPLFHADRDVDRLLDDIRQAVAGRVQGMWLAEMAATFRDPHPYYWTRVRTDRVAEDLAVGDQGVEYGGWLEGTSSRNRETRFKGYGLAAKTTAAIDAQAPRIIQPIIDDFIRRVS